MYFWQYMHACMPTTQTNYDLGRRLVWVWSPAGGHFVWTLKLLGLPSVNLLAFGCDVEYVTVYSTCIYSGFDAFKLKAFSVCLFADWSVEFLLARSPCLPRVSDKTMLRQNGSKQPNICRRMMAISRHNKAEITNVLYLVTFYWTDRETWQSMSLLHLIVFIL